MVDFDAYIERIREATLMSWEVSITGPYAAWRDRIQRILTDLSDEKDAFWSEMIDGE